MYYYKQKCVKKCSELQDLTTGMKITTGRKITAGLPEEVTFRPETSFLL